MAVRASGKKEDKPLPDLQDLATPTPWQESFNKDRPLTKFVDPCEAASKASMACLDKHDYDRDKCLEYFRAYRDCKKAWIAQRNSDRQAGRA